jgi:hypothetical protein
VRGATYASASAPHTSEGRGKALRSTFPFRVNGKRSNNTNDVGTMYSGSRPNRNSRNSAATPIAEDDDNSEVDDGDDESDESDESGEDDADDGDDEDDDSRPPTPTP